MSTRDIERELTAALHRHAEAAMSRTNTHMEHERFQDGAGDRTRRDRRRWIAGAAVAAAVVAVAGFAVWSADPGDERSDSSPAGDPGQSAEALAVAQGYADAFAAGDVDRAASYLAPKTAWEEVRGEMRAEGATAWRREYFFEPCQAGFTSVTGTRFTCPFSYHVLRSEDLGLGPFGGDTWLSAFVEDGKVTSTQLVLDYGDNGQAELFEAILAWIEQNHPRKVELIEIPSAEATPAEERRANQLFDQYVAEYVDAQTQ